MSKKKTLVFIPMAFIGHVYSAVDTAKRLVDRDDRLYVTVILMSFGADSSHSETYLDNLAAAATAGRPRIKFIKIIKDSSFSELMSGVVNKDFLIRFTEYHKPRVRDAIAELFESDDSAQLAGIVMDMTLMMSMPDIAAEFGVPAYVYLTSGAAFLGFLFHHQKLFDHGHFNPDDFKEPDAELLVPSYANPVPARVLPTFAMDHQDPGRRNLVADNVRRFGEAKGILVNTFEEFEPHALQSLAGKGPTIYPVGPIVNQGGATSQAEPEHGNDRYDIIMTWLEEQPAKSVVYLCFGSMGSFGGEQAREIARALERSGQRFLWSLRKPTGGDKFVPPGDYDDVEQVLPEGFLGRTAEVGKIIGWAPQMEILAHPAIGGFVSHCGWNSTLESLWHGVPVATWPLYAEQQLNAFLLVNELGLAVELTLDYQKLVAEERGAVLVREEVIERAIRRLMEQDSEVRRKVEEMKEASRKALDEGGSSYASLGRFINDVINGARGDD